MAEAIGLSLWNRRPPDGTKVQTQAVYTSTVCIIPSSS